MKPYRVIILFIWGTFILAGNAWAHRVNVFAWADGDTVYVESKFSGGKKIRGAEIIVSDAKGIVLLTGRTNDQGEFTFKRPQPTELNIVLQAGMGHRAEWTLPVEAGHLDHPPEDARAEKADAPNRPERQDGRIGHQHTGTQAAVYAGPSRSEIEAIVEKALDKKMKPVIEMLAESNAKGPDIGDIFGGIGYIIGLVGIGAYFHSRKKHNIN